MSDGDGMTRLAELLTGNGAFRQELLHSVDPDALDATLSTAHPVAAVLCCSDSRVPPEIVLGRDVGDLYVVRVAGNVAGSDEIGALEYAVARWPLSLILVLGHTECGAVAAVLDPPPAGAAAGAAHAAAGAHLASLLVSVRSSVAMGMSRYMSDGDDRWLAAVRANVTETVRSLQTRSSLIGERVRAGELLVAGAVYDVHTGCVEPLELA